MLGPGSSIGNFEVLDRLGAGSMGEVFRARDARLGRDVALKVLRYRVELDSRHRARFEREARMLASLNHPNIATLHGIEDLNGTPALVLEIVEGPTLAERIDQGPVALAETVRIAQQIAAGLEAAHEHGVVHRDMKPSNIKLRPDGTVKLLDFGVAKALASPGTGHIAEATVTALEHPAGGPAAIGTPAYMSPEQARGLPVDKRSDVWAFGCIVYELLTGKRAFPGEAVSEVVARVIEREPDFDQLPADTPVALRRLVERCLVKDSHRRLRDIGDARLELEELEAALRRDRSTSAGGPATSRPARRIAAKSLRGSLLAAVLAAAAAVAAYSLWSRDEAKRWLDEQAIPSIEAHLDVADWESAYRVAKEADARVPNSREVAELWQRLSWRVTIASEPSGATVFRQAYGAADDEWEELGRTPLQNVRIPYGLSRLRFDHEGYQPLLRAVGGGHLNWQELTGPDFWLDNLLVPLEITYELDRTESLPADKVRVPGGNILIGGEVLALKDFFFGRYEITNAEFKAFVDAGGYRRPELWDQIVLDGEIAPFDSAMQLFTDRTGRQGPSTWEAGDYPEGEAGFPVSGVSWYEAAAFARFVGEELPTAHHWQQALANSMFPWLLPLSNFGRDGPRPVAESRAMSYVGAFDMAGNVREWTATAIGDERIILGGSWNDAYYIAGTADTSASPLDRSPGNGIRLAVTHDEPAITDRVREPLIMRSTVSPVLEQPPVSDEVYAAYGRIFDYDRGPLNASVDATESTRVWTRERIRFDAGYGTDTMLLHLYLPAASSGPYQTVLYWPGWDTFGLDDVDQYFAKQIDFIVKSGRAVAFPVYKGTFERRVGNVRARADFGTAAYRDNAIDGVKDLRRTIDYLESRPDVDHDALALFGYSWGGVNGPIALAQEPRLALAVINIGLLPPMSATPEVDPVNALPRVNVPVLMLSGEFDAMVPMDNARRYFELIGVPPSDKRHVIAVGGHYVPRELLIRETLDWLDRYFGAARR